jgi:ABC-type polysaccharide/polyol phosphate transport system ATPase subunit
MSSPEYLVEVNNLKKQFVVRHEGRSSLKHMIVRLLRPYPHEPFWALKGVDLQVRGGEIVGLIGVNGSGKSTLLRIIAGIYVPTSGEVTVRGHVGAMFELESGFNLELTGVENALLSGLLMGYRRKDVVDALSLVEEASELDKFLDVPVKTYSSGMKFRLGFGIALAFRPEVLLVDEVMAAADEAFQRTVYERLHEFSDAGSAVTIVSHELDAVRKHCDRVAWVHEGLIRGVGPTEPMLEAYLAELDEADDDVDTPAGR